MKEVLDYLKNNWLQSLFITTVGSIFAGLFLYYWAKMLYSKALFTDPNELETIQERLNGLAKEKLCH